MQYSECKIQNAKCKHCITDSHSKFCSDDDRSEDSCYLISFTAQVIHFGRRRQFERRADSQPIGCFARFTQCDLNITYELAFRGRGFRFFEVGTDARCRLQQLIDEAPDTWTWLELESNSGDGTCESERSIADRLSGVSHALRRCTVQAVRVTHNSGEFRGESKASAENPTQNLRRPGRVCILNFAF